MSGDQDPELTVLLSTHGHKPVTVAVLDETISALQEGLRAAFQKHRDARLALEARVTELEARPLPQYLGTHKAGAHYPAHSMTTRAGSLWFATEGTTSTPGTDPSWKLIVKRGQV